VATTTTATLINSAAKLGQPTQQARFRDTPTRLTFRAALAVLAVALHLIISLVLLNRTNNGLNNAKSSADRIAAAQRIHINLSEADALATSGYLRSGLQPAEELQQFDANLSEAFADLARYPDLALLRVDATNEDPNSTLTGRLNQYNALVTSARDNNRQGFPVGATYQKSASTVLSTDIIPKLLQTDLSTRADLADSLNSNRLVPMLLVVSFVFLCLLPLGYGLVSLKKLTNRVINLPLFLGLIVAGMATLLCSSGALLSLSDAQTLATQEFRKSDLYGQARVALYEARAAEALTLIARGSGAEKEAAWQTSYNTVFDAMPFPLGSEEAGLVNQYGQEHVKVRTADDTGDWDGAVAMVRSTSPSEPGGPAFLAFQAADKRLEQGQLDVANALVGGFEAGSTRRLILISLLGNLMAAAFAWIGYQLRIREYR
jgi:hypothetical protein